MAVHVDNAMSEVVPEVEPSAGAGGGESEPWEEEERVSAAISRAALERARTAAEGFDD